MGRKRNVPQQRKHNKPVVFKDGLESLTNNLANQRNVSNTNKIVSTRLSGYEQNEIYKTGLGNKIVRLKIDSAYKEGLQLDNENDQEYFDNFLLKRIRKASRWLLGFGRGVICIVEPNKKVSDPLSTSVNLNTVLLHVFSGDIVTAQNASRDLKSKRYMKPIYYQIKGQNFHYSRVVDFRYVEPTQDDMSIYNYGGISEFDLIYQQLINDGVVERAAPTALEKNATVYYKLDGFKKALASGTEQNIIKYFQILENYRSLYASGIMDKTDDVESVTQQLTNLSETDTITLRRIAMVTGIPVSELIGENVKGLNSTGDNEKTSFNSTISSLQNNYLLEPINELLSKLGLSKAEFNKTDEMSPQEEAVYQGQVLENAIKLEALGKDPTLYLKESGIEADGFMEEFSEDEDLE